MSISMSSGSTAAPKSAGVGRVYRCDLEMYRALVGGPTDDSRTARQRAEDAAVVGPDAAWAAAEVAAAPQQKPKPRSSARSAEPVLDDSEVERRARRSFGPQKHTTVWEWAASCVDVAEFYCENISLRVGRMSLAHWVRRVSRDAGQTSTERRDPTGLESKPQSRP